MGRKHSRKGFNILEKCGIGIEDEHLDFEAEEIETEHNFSDESFHDLSVHESDESTTDLVDSEIRETHSISSIKTVNINDSLSGVSHIDEMLQVLPNNSFGSQNSDYLPLQINLSSNPFIDSSDSEEDDFNDAEYPTEEQEASLLESEDDMEEVEEYNEVLNEPIASENFLIYVSGDKRTLIGGNQIPNKRKKWGTTFMNGYKPVRLFLEDIGYESQVEENLIDNEVINNNNNNNSEYNSFTESVHQQVSPEKTTSSSFRITVDQRNSKRVCKKISSEFSVSSLSDNESFKMPLPPAKRPPTRPKRTLSDSSKLSFTRTISNVGSNSQISISNSQISMSNKTRASVDDDTLSIVAPSIIIEDQFEPETKHELLWDSDEQMSNMNDDIDRIANWVQEAQANSQWSSVFQLPQIQQPVLQQSDSNTLAVSDDSRATPRVEFRNVPPLFQGICYFNYINQNCKNKRCLLPHNICMGKFTKKAIHFPPEKLLESYKFMVENNLKKLYNECLIGFIKAFTHYKMKNELIFCVNDFYKFEVQLFDSIVLITNSLQEIGLTFLESIETMVMSLGLRLPEFQDILLEILTSKQEIKENWPMIRKIIKTVNRISPKLATKIFRLATGVYPLDRNLLIDINEVIIRNELTDLSQISQEALAPFKCLFSDNTTPRVPVAQTVIRLPISTNLENLSSQSSSIENPVQLIQTTKQQNILNKKKNDKNSEKNLQTERRNCDFRTGKVTTSFDSVSDSVQCYFQPPLLQDVNQINEISNPSASTSSITSREGSVFSDNQYVPQPIVPENRRDMDIRSFEVKQPEYKLSPSPPVIGTTILPFNFVINKSLHYLYPEVIKYSVSMDECDHFLLKQAVVNIDAPVFLKLLDKYKHPVTLEKFIIMTIINLKDRLEEATKTLRELLFSIGDEYLDTQTKKLVKVVFEVIVMNLLMEMKKVCNWSEAVQLLEYFSDWDGLVSSQLFQNFGSNHLTHMGKYLFLAWILCKGRNFHYAYRILMSSELRLMGDPSRWPFFNSPQSDLKYRNEVLDDYLQFGYSNYVLGALQVHKYMLTSDEFHGYNRRQQQGYLNLMLTSLIESGKTTNLVCCVNFLDCFYKILDRGILRSLASAVVDRLSKEQQVKLYDFCCKREVYPMYTGEEENIIIRTDNSDNEIILTLNFFFYKRSQIPLPSVKDLYIDIKLQDYSGNYIKLIRDCLRSILDVNMAVKYILRENFNMLVRESQNNFVLEIPSHEVSNVLKEQYNWQIQL